MKRASVVASSDALSEAKQQQRGKSGRLGQKKKILSDADVLQAAQRYFLSPSVVREAHAVFAEYCAVEEQRRGRMVSPSASRPESLSVTDRRKSTQHSKEQRPDSPADHQTEREEERGEEEEGEEEEEQRLGVDGLQQFFKDLGMRMSALEVSDRIHDLNGEPMDFVLWLRAMEAKAAAAGGGSCTGESQSGKSPPAHKTGGSSRRKENNTDSGSGGGGRGGVHAADSGPDSYRRVRASVCPASNTTTTRNDVTFSLFLFILSHVLLEKENNAEARDAEVRDVFQRVDVDTDGVISVKDVQSVVSRLVDEGALTNDRDIQCLCEMNMVELKTALMECDVDNDGLVTVSDLLAVLRS